MNKNRFKHLIGFKSKKSLHLHDNILSARKTNICHAIQFI